MGDNKKYATVVVLCLLWVLLAAIPVYAYVDPNAAGLVSQILTPLLIFVAAGFTFLRKQIGTVLAVLSRRLRRSAHAE
jgi:hypothetical protein